MDLEQRENSKKIKLKSLFKTEFPVIGVLHLPALQVHITGTKIGI